MASRLLHLLRRSTRLYSTSSAPFPYQAPISAAGASNPHNHDPVNSDYPNIKNLETATVDTPQYNSSPNPQYQPAPQYNPYPNPQFHPPPFQHNSNQQFQPSAGDSPNFQYSFQFSNHFQSTISSPNNASVNLASSSAPPSVPVRLYGFSSAEEAAQSAGAASAALELSLLCMPFDPTPPTPYPMPMILTSLSYPIPHLLWWGIASIFTIGSSLWFVLVTLTQLSMSFASLFSNRVRLTIFTCNAIIAAIHAKRQFKEG